MVTPVAGMVKHLVGMVPPVAGVVPPVVGMVPPVAGMIVCALHVGTIRLVFWGVQFFFAGINETKFVDATYHSQY